VGKTRFNDEALREAGKFHNHLLVPILRAATGEMTIYNMRQNRPAYNLISNNCQNFAIALLDAIHVGAHKEFATTFAVYQRATGAGTVNDLFAETLPNDEGGDQKPVEVAQHVMEENTTKLDSHEDIHF